MESEAVPTGPEPAVLAYTVVVPDYNNHSGNYCPFWYLLTVTSRLRVTKGWLVINRLVIPIEKGNSEGTFTSGREAWAPSKEQTESACEEIAEHIRRVTEGVTPETFMDEIALYRGLNSAEHATDTFPDIDWEVIESQGWTQYGPWNTTDSQELSDGSQEWVTGHQEITVETPGTPEIPETPPQLPEPDTTEQPQKRTPRYGIDKTRFTDFQDSFGPDEDPKRIKQIYDRTMLQLEDIRNEL